MRSRMASYGARHAAIETRRGRESNYRLLVARNVIEAQRVGDVGKWLFVQDEGGLLGLPIPALLNPANSAARSRARLSRLAGLCGATGRAEPQAVCPGLPSVAGLLVRPDSDPHDKFD